MEIETLFYMEGGSEAAVNSFLAHADSISIVGPQVYFVGRDGVVWGEVDGRVLEASRSRGVAIMPLVMNPGFDQEEFAALLHAPDARQRVVDFLVREGTRYGYYGWQFDFEHIVLDDAELYVQAATALRAAGLRISMAVVPDRGTSSLPTSYHRYMRSRWRGCFTEHYARISTASTFVSLMTYSQHTGNTPPGPIAGLPWISAMSDFALRSIDAEKLSIGIPVYSNHWFAEYEAGRDFVRVTGGEMHYSKAAGLAQSAKAASELKRPGYTYEERWEAADGVTMVTFEREFIREVLCLETAKSFEAKLKLLRERYVPAGVARVSVWVLGAEDPGIWEVLEREVSARRVAASSKCEEKS